MQVTLPCAHRTVCGTVSASGIYVEHIVLRSPPLHLLLFQAVLAVSRLQFTSFPNLQTYYVCSYSFIYKSVIESVFSLYLGCLNPSLLQILWQIGKTPCNSCMTVFYFCTKCLPDSVLVWKNPVSCCKIFLSVMHFLPHTHWKLHRKVWETRARRCLCKATLSSLKGDGSCERFQVTGKRQTFHPLSEKGKKRDLGSYWPDNLKSVPQKNRKHYLPW